jgi:signal transduction histidine kinase
MINNPLKLNESKYSGLSKKIVDKNSRHAVSNIVTDFKKQANDGVSILYDAHDVVVCPDRDKISQVIHNLISNA